MALHVVSILDRSGSMTGTENEVIGAYNDFVEKQKKIAKENNIKTKKTLVLFDNNYEEVYKKVDIESVPTLDDSVYYVRGMTALCDAIGKTIANFEGKKKVIFFIETDGAENASREYNLSSLKTLIEKKKADGWDFNFVGADLDSVTTTAMASSFSIDVSKAQAFAKNAGGYAARNNSWAAATTAYINKGA
jgi:hypothetical protein